MLAVSVIGAALVLAGLFGRHLLTGSVHAATTLTETYATSEKLTPGTIVSLEKGSLDRVKAAAIDNANNLFGVVVGDGSSLLTLTDGQSDHVLVATNGVVDVMVSDINGDIESGDQITISTVKGVGMKTTSNAKIIGTAQSGLQNGTVKTAKIKDGEGKEHEVRLSQIPVLVNVAYYYRQPDKTIIPQAVQNVANAIAGKKVNTMPILISIGLFVVTLIVVVSIIYSMIRSSIISVGRNPMSQSAVYRNLLQMSALVMAILVVATIAIYMVLTKF